MQGPERGLAGNRVAALVKVEAAIEALDKVAGKDVSTLQRLLALAANSIARTSRNDAQQQALHEVDSWLTDGESKLAAGKYAQAVRSFRFATARAQG